MNSRGQVIRCAGSFLTHDPPASPNPEEGRTRRKNQEGVALFLVLWILTLLSVLAGEFCYSMRVETHMTRHFAEEGRAYYYAYAGIQMGIEQLVRARTMPVPRKEALEGEEEEIPWRVNASIPPIPFGEGQFQIRLENESGKVNLNRADGPILRMLLNSFDLDDHEKDVIVDSIMDWRDADSLTRLNGAEDDYYRGLPNPYACKNGDFDAIEELRLVRGVTEEVFFGLKDLVTVIGPPLPARKPGAYGKININAASGKMLASLPGMTEEMIEEIDLYRGERDFTSLNDLLPLVGANVFQAVLPYLTLEWSPYFTIHSTGISRDGATRENLSAVVKIDATAPRRYRLLKWYDSPST
jgi:general secretion pathway protein K